MYRVFPTIENREIIARLDCDLFLDVGANRGQFSLLCQCLHPKIPIVAFEPIPSEAAVYRQLFLDNGLVTLKETALGEQCDQVMIRLSRRLDSSSLLKIGDWQMNVFPATEEVGTLQVKLETLDSYESLWKNYHKALLKIDVQGYELSVLRGAGAALSHCSYVYCECSEVPLYEGQALSGEVANFLSKHGFRLEYQANQQFHKGQLIQSDCLFVRSREQPGPMSKVSSGNIT